MSEAISDTVALLAEARDWRTLGLLFECPRGAWHEELRTLARELEPGEVRSLAESADSARQEEYLALLGPGSTVSPRQVAYVPMGDPGKILAQLAHVYGAFGYQSATGEPLDHVATQLGFVSFLCLKKVFAHAQGLPEQAASCEQARNLVIEEHLSSLASGLAVGLEPAEGSYLEAAARHLRRLMPPEAAVRTALPVLDNLQHMDEAESSRWSCGCDDPG